MKKVLSLFAATLLTALFLGCSHKPATIYLNCASQVATSTAIGCNLYNYYTMLRVWDEKSDNGNSVSINLTNVERMIDISRIDVNTKNNTLFTFSSTQNSDALGCNLESLSGTYDKNTGIYDITINCVGETIKVNNNITEIYNPDNLKGIIFEENGTGNKVSFPSKGNIKFAPEEGHTDFPSYSSTYTITQLSNYCYELKTTSKEYILSFDSDSVSYEHISLVPTESSSVVYELYATNLYALDTIKNKTFERTAGTAGPNKITFTTITEKTDGTWEVVFDYKTDSKTITYSGNAERLPDLNHFKITTTVGSPSKVLAIQIANESSLNLNDDYVTSPKENWCTYKYIAK